MLTYVGIRNILFSLTLSCLLIVYFQYWKTQRCCDELYSLTFRMEPPPPALVLELREKPLENTQDLRRPKSSQNEQGKQTNLMIISQGRSGSSFIGQIFNHHPDVFYIYEPLHTLERVDNFDNFIGNNTSEYNQRASMILEEIFNCSFRKSPYLDYLSRPGHFRLSSRVLRSPPFCTREAENTTAKEVFEKQLCSYLEPVLLNQVCKKYSVTVMKVLEHRLIGRTLESLKPLLEMEEYDNKILYLVRDPRAVISSMYQAGWIASIGKDGQLIPYQPISRRFHWYVQRICHQMETNVKFVKHPPYWSKKRLFLLRYEDLITNPENITKDMFEFIDLGEATGIKEWVYDHMNAHNTTLGGTEETYATKKNASLTLKKWRLEASREMVKVVEKHCKTVMDLLSYTQTKVLRLYSMT
ncbi:carbohydrate sulfotransferase 5-like [Actinia tenebrosa]|uniref:Carbohydrate sulfotransferase 5-like n=1 Tax=Actinia tenebrosa TaxID=6105 RepID=A0A6P8IQD8_ACTTE|nr:carbohydrate sulfotransferase 5-like [Actinia tenebrosa]